MVFFNIVRKLSLVVLALGMLAPALTEAQPARPPPPGNPTKRMGFLLQIFDPEKLLTTEPRVTLKGSQGTARSLRPEDKGNRRSADVAAGDNIYSAPVPGFPDPAVTITIKSGAQSWTIKVKLDPNDIRALVLLKVSAGGKVAQTSRIGSSQPVAKPGSTPGARTGWPSSTPQKKRLGFLLQLHDKNKLMKSPPLVTLTGLMGSVLMVQPKDSGKQIHSDAVAGDGVYSCPASLFPGGVVTISVRSGTLKWVIKIKLNPKEKRPLVVLMLQRRGRVKQVSRAEVAPPVAKEVIHPGVPRDPEAPRVLGKPDEQVKPGVPPTATKGRPGFLLQIYDPKSYLKKPPRVTLRGSLGTERVVIPEDSGKIQHSDVARGDHIFSGPAPFFPDGVVNVTIKSERRTWKIKVKLDPDEAQALVFLQLFKNGKVKEVPRDVVGKPLPPGHVGLGRNLGEVRPVIPTVTRTTRPKGQGSANLGSGFVLWALAFVTLGLGVAITLALTGRRPRDAARLAASGGAPITPVQLEETAVAAALEGPLAGHRVVLLGDGPRDAPRVVRCLEQNPLPEELVTAVERLAVSPGPAVALLVTDPELLDRAGPTDPVITLSKRVAQRFPLWVVDGPEEWDIWPENEKEELNKEQKTENRKRGIEEGEQETAEQETAEQETAEQETAEQETEEGEEGEAPA